MRFSQFSLLALSFTALLSVVNAQPIIEGQVQYETHCKACHLLDSTSVGPSLIAMAAIYPKEEEETFLAWTKKPGKKNKKMIQMPSMAHIPDADLKKIHQYILVSTKGKKQQSGKRQFPKYKPVKRKLPYVVRAFMPSTSPASVATMLPKSTSVCWDAEACRFRYAWRGSKTNINGYFGPTHLTSRPFYRETANQLFVGVSDENPIFLGYRLIKGYPEFHYKIGDLEIKELLTDGDKKHSFKRRFTLEGVDENITLDLAHTGKADISSDKGKIVDHKLTLTSSEAQTFTLTISKK